VTTARRSSAAALFLYLVLSLVYFGAHVATAPATRHVGGLFTDPQIFVWSLAWWPHAILHGENPLYTHAIWAPDGFNLAWATTMPALSIALAPLTLAFGPVFAYNVACVLMPALGAWTAFLLCRYLTHSTWAAVVGGYLFGFSSYMLGGELSHVHTVAVFLVPVAALLVLRFLDGELSARRLALGLGVVLAAQLWLSTEIVFTATLALVGALLLAAVLVPARRRRLRLLLAPLAGAYAFAAVLAAPLLYYVVTGRSSHPTQQSSLFVADALNFVVPTRASVGGWWTGALVRQFPANDIERGAYLGLPLLLLVGWFAVERRRSPAARFLLVSFAVAMVASLGSWLTVDGDRLVTLPWVHVASRPLFEDVMPVRFAMYTALISAVIVALWASSPARRRSIRVLLPALAVVALLPNLAWSAWARSPEVPSLFTTGAYRHCLHRGENILVFPVGSSGDSMIWQADSGFWFRIAGGYIAPKIPSSFMHPAGITHLTTGDNPSEVTLAAVLELARLKGVTSLVVDARDAATWRPILARLGPPAAVGGALIYRVSGKATRCAGTA
jgi:hypothetical protein